MTNANKVPVGTLPVQHTRVDPVVGPTGEPVLRA